MKEAFITLKNDGSVDISGGLIFHNKAFCIFQDSDISKYNHKINKNSFYCESPKWYEIIKWYKLIKLIKQFTN